MLNILCAFGLNYCWAFQPQLGQLLDFTHHASCHINVAYSEEEMYTNWCVLLLVSGAYGRVSFDLTLSSDSGCHFSHFYAAEHLLILKTTCRQAASGSFIMTKSLGRLAVSLFLCLLRPVTETGNLYKDFYRTAVNKTRAGKMTRFPADTKTYS